MKSSKGTRMLVKGVNLNIRTNENDFEWFQDHLMPITVNATFTEKGAVSVIVPLDVWYQLRNLLKGLECL